MEKNEKAKNKEINKEAIAESIRKTLEKEEKENTAESEEPKPVEQPALQEPPVITEPASKEPAPAPEPEDTEQNNSLESAEPDEQNATQLQTENVANEPEPPKSLAQPKQKQEAAKTPPKQKKVPALKNLKGRIRRLSKKNGILLVLVELILVLLLAVILSQHISINTRGTTTDSDFTDEISCSDGQLNVNTVSVSVPTDGGVSYSISYDWGKDDKDYPTVPKAAIASYHTEGSDLKYDISLYRESFTPIKKIPEGKKPSNWFADWKTISDDNSKQEPKTSGDINGFLVSTVGNDPDGAYETTSFYFAVKTKAGVSVYVVEGLLYDKTAEKEFNKVMEDVISSVRTKKQAA